MIPSYPPAVNPPLPVYRFAPPVILPDHHQPAAIADQLSGFAAALLTLDADDLAAESLSAEALAFELAARAADAEDELAADLERRALSASCRLGAGIFTRPAARGAIRSMAFA